MGDIISAISDDIEEYEDLCDKFKQKVQYSKTSQGYDLPDCYGKHAMKLKAMEMEMKTVNVKQKKKEKMKFTESKSKRYDQIVKLITIKKLAEKLIEELSDDNGPISGLCQEALQIERLAKNLNNS